MSWHCSRKTWTARCRTSQRSACYWHHRHGRAPGLGSSESCAGLGCRSVHVRLWRDSLVRRWEVCRRTSWALPSGSSRMSPSPSRSCCWVSVRRSCCRRMRSLGSKDCARVNAGSWAVSRTAKAWADVPASAKTADHRGHSWSRPSAVRPLAASRMDYKKHMAQSRLVCR